MISLIIPTYNEEKNIEECINRANTALSSYNHEIIVIDDNSQDRTASIAESLGASVFVRKKDRGLAKSVVCGINQSKGEIIGVMDADLSHPPELIPELIKTLDNYDIAIASRLVEGGGAEGWPRHRKFSSFIGTFIAKGLTSISDPMSGFFFLKRSVIEKIPFKPKGYKILLEILIKGNYNGVKEVPFIFRDRTQGESKLSFFVGLEYILQTIELYWWKLANRKANPK